MSETKGERARPRPSRKKKKRGDKKKTLEQHAGKRALQRYGISITKEARNNLIRKVRAGKATKIEDQSLRVGVYEAEYGDQIIRFAYDKRRKTIITFLHRDQNKYSKEARQLAGMRRG